MADTGNRNATNIGFSYYAFRDRNIVRCCDVNLMMLLCCYLLRFCVYSVFSLG